MKRLEELGIPIHTNEISHVKSGELDDGLKRGNLNRDTFSEYFGIQTCPIVDGEMCYYPWDVEAVLERMLSGKLTGTQLYWD